MSSLKTNDKQILEKLFQMEGGYVLNFTDKTIQEYRDVIKEEYSAEISWEEAVEHVNTLVGYFDVLLQIDMRDNPKKYGRRD